MNNFTFPPHFLVTSRLIFRSSRWFSPAGTVPAPRRLATADCWRHPLRGPRSGSRSSSSGWALHQPGGCSWRRLYQSRRMDMGVSLTWGIPKNLMAFLKCVNGSMTWMIRWLWGWPYLRKPSNFRSQRLLSEKVGAMGKAYASISTGMERDVFCWKEQGSDWSEMLVRWLYTRSNHAQE